MKTSLAVALGVFMRPQIAVNAFIQLPSAIELIIISSLR